MTPGRSRGKWNETNHSSPSTSRMGVPLTKGADRLVEFSGCNITISLQDGGVAHLLPPTDTTTAYHPNSKCDAKREGGNS